jgi:hypothetical protein
MRPETTRHPKKYSKKFNSRDAVQGAKHSNTEVLRALATP